ncbi:hypothetical protein C0J52_04210 [Blattella germanica]|nr:hypothetical protein C0J52_04210 [Blattella germanica]
MPGDRITQKDTSQRKTQNQMVMEDIEKRESRTGWRCMEGWRFLCNSQLKEEEEEEEEEGKRDIGRVKRV